MGRNKWFVAIKKMAVVITLSLKRVKVKQKVNLYEHIQRGLNWTLFMPNKQALPRVIIHKARTPKEAGKTREEEIHKRRIGFFADIYSFSISSSLTFCYLICAQNFVLFLFLFKNRKLSLTVSWIIIRMRTHNIGRHKTFLKDVSDEELHSKIHK